MRQDSNEQIHPAQPFSPFLTSPAGRGAPPISIGFGARGDESAPAHSLRTLIASQSLRAVFQPIVSLRAGEIVGYEGLIRGPRGHALEAPAELFAAADEGDLLGLLEGECLRTVTSRFAKMRPPGRLFLNLLPSTIMAPHSAWLAIIAQLRDIGLRPNQIVLEMTEHQPQADLSALRSILSVLRDLGFTIAIDDLGAGFASLKLWSELRPEYVKIDKHFIDNLHRDSFKIQFVRAIHEISSFSGAAVIAEGIECEAQLRLLRDVGIEFGQGHFLGWSTDEPARACAPEARAIIDAREIAVIAPSSMLCHKPQSVGSLVTRIEPVSPLETNAEVMARFHAEPESLAFPVVLDGTPIGMLRRNWMVQEFSRQFRHELFDKRPCTMFMDNDPLVVEAARPLQEVGTLLTELDRRHLSSGFIVTQQGKYLGVCNSQHLLREFAKIQLTAARHSNPLTLLPGNVPIAEHVDRLLAAGVEFVACYCDIDNFKPYNDIYGYRKGDEMIRMLANALQEVCDPQRDFLGHIGGDDFVLHLQSQDWEERCRRALTVFDERARRILTPADLERNGYAAEDRDGREAIFGLPALSIGAVAIDSDTFRSHAEVAVAMTVAKKEAKRVSGSSLFVERRRQASVAAE
jgi:diguanylate cyclase (GGDEF)-like protein